MKNHLSVQQWETDKKKKSTEFEFMPCHRIVTHHKNLLCSNQGHYSMTELQFCLCEILGLIPRHWKKFFSLIIKYNSTLKIKIVKKDLKLPSSLLRATQVCSPRTRQGKEDSVSRVFSWGQLPVSALAPKAATPGQHLEFPSTHLALPLLATVRGGTSSQWHKGAY